MIFFKKNTPLFLACLFFTSLQISSILHANVSEISEENKLTKIFESHHDTIIMSSSNHCHWCEKTKPHFIALAEKYSSKINFYIVNYSQTKLQKFLNDFTHDGAHLTHEVMKLLKKSGALSAHKSLSIPGNPTFLYLKHGKIVDIHIGGCDLETLEKFIKKNHK